MPLVTSISKNMRRNAPLLLKANRRKLLVIFIKKFGKISGMIQKKPKTNQKCQSAYINFLSNSKIFLQKKMPIVLDFVFLPCEVAIIYFLFASNSVSDLRLFLSESVPTLYIRRKERCRSTFRIDLCIISLFSD